MDADIMQPQPRLVACRRVDFCLSLNARSVRVQSQSRIARQSQTDLLYLHRLRPWVTLSMPAEN
jgi:hypothetical protein